MLHKMVCSRKAFKCRENTEVSDQMSVLKGTRHNGDTVGLLEVEGITSAFYAEKHTYTLHCTQWELTICH